MQVERNITYIQNNTFSENDIRSCTLKIVNNNFYRIYCQDLSGSCTLRILNNTFYKIYCQDLWELYTQDNLLCVRNSTEYESAEKNVSKQLHLKIDCLLF